jgi:hypothetical protein
MPMDMKNRTGIMDIEICFMQRFLIEKVAREKHDAV